VDRSQPELLEELFDFLRIPSISSGDGEAADLRRGAEWVCARVRDAGGTAAVVETARNPLAIGHVACGIEGAPRVLVYGHYDVQTVHPLAAWDSPPFAPELRDGFIYGRGAADDKGNLHCLLAPLVDLARAGALAVDVTVVSDGEEEIGGDSVVRWLEAGADAFDAAVVFDSGLVAPGWPMLCTGVRGVMTGQLRVTTGTRDVHSGLYGGAALNAAHVLAALIDGTRARAGRLPVALEQGVRAPTAAEVASWATLPPGADELATGGMAPLDAGATEAFYERTFARPTFDVNAITCRDATHNRTIIPFEATAAFSLRLVPDQDPAVIAVAFSEHVRALAPAGAAVEVHWWASAAGCAFDPSSAPLRIARRVLTAVFGRECAVARSGGAIPLVSALHRAGIPTILTGVSLPDDNIHAPNERLRLDNYLLGVEAGRRLLVELGALR
jgi:acetylornithine deacetylase/succinyl-diaminopimelate desuccinylase-like protein